MVRSIPCLTLTLVISSVEIRSRLNRLLKGLLSIGSRLNKFFINGTSCQIEDHDIDSLAKFLTESGIYDLIAKYLSFEKVPLDEVSKIYTELVEDTEEEHSKYIEFYFKNFYKRFIQNQDLEDEPCLTQQKWDQVLNWVIALSINDSSIMVKWADDGEDLSLINL